MSGIRIGWLAGGLAVMALAASAAAGQEMTAGAADVAAEGAPIVSEAEAPAVVVPAPMPPSGETAPAGAPPAGVSQGAAGPADQMFAAAGAPEISPAGPLLPQALSPWGMFMAADVVVKGVMIGLAFASLVTWTIGLAKFLEGMFARRQLRRGLKAVLAAEDLSALAITLGQRGGAAGLMVRAAQHEVAASAAAIDAMGADGLLDRVASSLSRIEARVGRRLAVGTGILATIGSTAPFVGLFGTVWGIMNSFIGIAESQTTNLAVVAPGIAEALLATALGLVAAIPAVMIYNHFARSIAGCRALLADTAAGVEQLVSRDLDLRRLTVPALRRAAE